MADEIAKPNSEVRLITVDDGSHDRRLDNFLISLLKNIPHSRIYNLIRTGQVRVNGSRAKAKRRLEAGDIVRVPPVRMARENRSASLTKPLLDAVNSVIYEDDYLIAIDKPSGIAVHSGTNHKTAFIEAIRAVRGNDCYVELVHRLDKETSGILILAKDKRFLRQMHRLWRRESLNGELTKTYTALLKGQLEGNSHVVRSALVRRDSERLASRDTSIPVAESVFESVQKYNGCSLVHIELHTGKNHQARRHAAEIGCPIAGDRKYGDRNFNDKMKELGLKRLYLHASKIRLFHPVLENYVEFQSAVPSHLSDFLNTLPPDP